MSNHPQRGKHHQPANPKQDSTQKESTNRHVYIEPGAQIDFVKNLREKYDAAQRDDQTHKANQLFWTKVAAGLVLLAAGFSGWQGYLTRQLALTARQTLAADQRPWARIHWATPPQFEISSVRTAQTMGVSNVGRSPMLNLWMHGAITKLENGTQPSFDFKHETTGIRGVIFPDDPMTSFPVVDSGVNEAEMEKINKGDIVVLTYGWLRYDDVLGNTYWQQFCNWPDIASVSPMRQSVTHKMCVEYTRFGTQKH